MAFHTCLAAATPCRMDTSDQKDKAATHVCMYAFPTCSHLRLPESHTSPFWPYPAVNSVQGIQTALGKPLACILLVRLLGTDGYDNDNDLLQQLLAVLLGSCAARLEMGMIQTRLQDVGW